jgi:hypothetical protein
MLKSKKNGTRDENSSAQHVIKKTQTIKRALTLEMFNHSLFFPPSFRSHIVSMPC